MMVSVDNLGFTRVLGMCKNFNHNILLAQPQNSPRRCNDCSSPSEGLYNNMNAGLHNMSYKKNV